MRIIRGFILSLLALALTACQKNDVEPNKPDVKNDYYQEVDNLFVLDESATKFIDEEITSDSCIVFSADTPEEAIPKVGTGIFIPESDKAPYGMLAKVLSVNKESERIVVTTEALPLAEAFESLPIDSSLPWETTLEGVFDEEGNPVEYEIVGKNGATTRSTDFELTENGLSIPVKTGQDGVKGSYAIGGNVGIFFEKFDFSIDIDKHGVNGISLIAAPSIEVDFDGEVELKAERERLIELFKKQIHTVRFKIRIPTPVAGFPIIIPVRISFDCLFETSGTVAWDFGVKYKNTLDCKVVYEGGKWGSEVKSVKSSNDNPWTVTQNIGVDGEIDLGVKVGILAGLYTTNIGIGVYATPKVYLGGEAELDSEDLYKVNPSLEYGLKISSEVYAIAKLFGKNLGKYTVELPDYTLWSKTLPLLPSLSGFEAKRIGNATKSVRSASSGKQVSVEIRWRQNPEYFMSSKDVKTGVAIFNKTTNKEVASFMPTPDSEPDGSYSYKTTVPGLSTDSTYYAETFAYWDGYKKFGEDNGIDTRVRKRIKTWKIGKGNSFSEFFTLGYDEKNRVVSYDSKIYVVDEYIYDHIGVVYSSDTEAVVNDNGEKIAVEFRNGLPIRIGGDSIQHDSAGHVIGNGHCENTWYGGNIVTSYQEEIRTTREVSYTSHPNLFYPDIISNVFLSLPDYYNILVRHHITKDLPSRIVDSDPTNGSFSWNITYAFDSDGYVSSFTESLEGLTYSFEYETY